MKSLFYDQARIHTLQAILCSKLDDLFDRLRLSFHRTGKYYVGPCPVHGGNNQGGFNLYHGGEQPGKWRCNTRHCENKYKKTILGFIRGVISQQSGKPHSFEEAIKWACDFIERDFESLEANDEGLEKSNFIASSAIWHKSLLTDSAGKVISRSRVREKLKIPASYFVRRGYSPEILNKYDVGLCDDPKKPFYNRVVVPIYDESYSGCVGFTGRSIFERCELCSLWHEPNLPCPISQTDKQACCKWKNSSFQRENVFFNHWFAKEAIKKTGVAILVEGPPDTLRVVEAGFLGCLGMLGLSLSDRQQCILETSGAVSVIVLTNNDEPGKKAGAAIAAQLKRLYRVFVPEIKTKDLGEMSPEATKELLCPIMERARK